MNEPSYNPKGTLQVDFAPAQWDYASAPCNTRMTSGEFAAEIVVDNKTRPPIFHSIIQKTGSSEIVLWSQATSFQEAEDQTQDLLTELSRGQAKAS